MLRVRRSFYCQVAVLVLAIALVFALSRFFPVVDFIQALQKRVMSLGAWAAICYPLLFAICNVLLLPGGILAVGGGYFFGLTSIRFGLYMLWASIGRIPGLFLYVYVGTLGQLAVRIMRGENYPRTIEYWMWGGIFVTTILLLVVLGRIAHGVIQTSQAAAR